MPPRQRARKRPGGPPLAEARALYIDLVSKGLSNSAACRIVGVNRRTGTRWRRGRTIVNSAGKATTYAPIVVAAPGISDRFLSEAERPLIADAVAEGLRVRAIAAKLNRSPSTISRELRRNVDPVSGRYSPFAAHRRALDRRRRPKPGKFSLNPELRTFVQDHLDKRWSPEQIAKTLPRAFPDRLEMRVCAETIYQGVYVPRLGNLQRCGVRVLRSGRSRRRPQRRLDQRMTRFVEPTTMIDDAHRNSRKRRDKPARRRRWKSSTPKGQRPTVTPSDALATRKGAAKRSQGHV